MTPLLCDCILAAARLYCVAFIYHAIQSRGSGGIVKVTSC
jgi:hypothetical protein